MSEDIFTDMDSAETKLDEVQEKLKEFAASKKRAHTSWRCMKQRCKKSAHYINKGIDYTPQWESFPVFYAQMGGCPVGHSLDRKNVFEGYSKENCRWATKSVQANNMSSNHYVEYKDFKGNLRELCTKLNLNYHRVSNRIRIGKWSVEKAVEEPVSERHAVAGRLGAIVTNNMQGKNLVKDVTEQLKDVDVFVEVVDNHSEEHQLADDSPITLEGVRKLLKKRGQVTNGKN